MPASSIFPAYIVDEYRPGNGFKEFERTAAGSAERTRRTFEASFAEIEILVTRALSRPAGKGMAIDLGVDQMRQAAADARAYADNLRVVLEAQVALAQSTGDTTEKTTLMLRVLQQQAIEANTAAQANERMVQTYVPLQETLNRTAGAATAAAAAMRSLYSNQIAAANADVAGRRFDAFLGVGTSARNNGATTSALEQKAALDELRLSEANAAAAADLLATIQDRVGISATRAAGAARESAQVFELAARAEERLAAEAERAWVDLEQIAPAARAAELALRQAGLAAASAFSEGNSAAEQFARNLTDVSAVAARALSTPRTSGGSLDVGLSSARDDAAAAQAKAIALREVATAAERVALAEGATAQETQLYVQAARAAAVAAEGESQALNEQVVVLGRLQAELSRSRSGTDLVIASNNRLASAQGFATHAASSQSFAMMEFTHIFRAAGDAITAGIPITQVIAMESTRAAQAMTYLGSSAGAIGRFMAGGWGLAFTAAISVLSIFISSMRSATSASEEALTGAHALSEAQAALGGIFDLSTGKIEHNTEALRLNARMQAITLRAEAGRHLLEADATLRDAGTIGYGVMAGEYPEALEQSRRVEAIIGRIGLPRTDPNRLEREQAMTLIERLGGDGSNWRLHASPADIAGAINSQVQAAEAGRYAMEIDQSLDRNRPAADLLRNRNATRPREDRRPDEATRELEDVTRINEQWDAQPHLVDQADQAVRRLHTILQQAVEQKQPANVMAQLTAGAQQAEQSIRDGLVRQITQGFQEAPRLIQRASLAMDQLTAAASKYPDILPKLREAGQVILTAINRPFREYLDDQVRSFDTQRLISQGRLEEADALGVIARLEREMGPLDDAHKQKVLETVAALRAQAEQMEIIRQHQQAYTQATAGVRSSIEDLLANPQRGLAGISNFLGGLTTTFSHLSAQVTTERLFGPILRQMDDIATGRTRLKQSNDELAASIDRTRAAEEHHGDTIASVTAKFEQLGTAVTAATAAATNLANWRNAGSGPAGLGGTTTETGVQPFGSISSGFGPRARPIAGASANHPGYDFPAAYGTPIRAPFSGRVAEAGPKGGYGNAVVLDLGNGFQSLDGHMSSVAVSVGQLVHQGEVIGRVGATGVATGNHLHEEFRRDGQAVDPATVYGHDFQVNVAAAHEAVQHLGTGLADLTPILNGLSDAVEPASQVIRHAMDTVDEAIRSANDIVVNGKRPSAANDNAKPQPGLVTDSTANLNPHDFIAQLVGQSIGRLFGGEEGAIKMGKTIGQYTATAIQGVGLGQFGGSMILGSGGDRTGEAIGGALGNIAGKAFGNLLGKSLGSLGQFAGPIGSVVGGVLGGLVGGLFKPPPPTGTAVISSYSGAPSVSGNNSGAQQQASDMADSVQQALRNIAQQLGGTIVDGGGRVAIGTYNGTVRVSPSGGPIHGKNTDSINYGTDTAAAVKAATLNLIQDGMIAGLRASTQRLLSAAKDLNTGLQNALDFESVFSELKQHLDPVGAALDTLDKRFEHLKELFKEAGASTEEYAQLEQLYQLDRKDAIDQAGQQLTSALKSLLDDLTTNNSALSLRDRLASAHATYDPLASRVAAGDTSVNYDDFAAAARALLDIQRQISGSDQPYFDLLAQVTDLTKSTLDAQNARIDAASASPGPLDTVTAGDTQTVSAIGQLGDILVSQLGGQLTAVNDNLGTVIGLLANQAGGGSSGGGFDDRFNF